MWCSAPLSLLGKTLCCSHGNHKRKDAVTQGRPLAFREEHDGPRVSVTGQYSSISGMLNENSICVLFTSHFDFVVESLFAFSPTLWLEEATQRQRGDTKLSLGQTINRLLDSKYGKLQEKLGYLARLWINTCMPWIGGHRVIKRPSSNDSAFSII